MNMLCFNRWFNPVETQIIKTTQPKKVPYKKEPTPPNTPIISRASSLDFILPSINYKNILCKEIEKHRITQEAVLGIIRDTDKYQEHITDYNMAECLIPLFENFHKTLSLEEASNEKDTIQNVLDYLNSYQEISTKMHMIQKEEKHTTWIQKADTLSRECLTQLLNNTRIGFPDGWRNHSISTQIELSKKNQNTCDIKVRLFNAGEFSDQHPRVNKAEEPNSSDNKVRTVIEFEKKQTEFFQIRTLIHTFIIQYTKESILNQETCKFNEKKQYLLNSGFKEISPNDEANSLGEFEGLSQDTGVCLIRSLLENVRSLMILKLGIQEGENLYENFQAFIKNDTLPTCPTTPDSINV